MIEMATGKFPYEMWRSPFDQLKQVVGGAPPRLPADSQFSDDFKDFIAVCLQKTHTDRPNYEKLLKHRFLTENAAKETDVAAFVEEILDLPDVVA